MFQTKVRDLSALFDLQQPSLPVPVYQQQKFADGVHLNIPDHEYHGEPSAVSSTRLKVILESPSHFKHALETPYEDKPHFDLGKAVHAALLEPDRFFREFVPAPEKDSRKKVDIERYEARMAELKQNGLTPIDGSFIDVAHKVVNNVQGENPLLWQALGQGVSESSIFWTDHETGLRCKVRPDNNFDAGDRYLMTDVKTLGRGGANPKDFGRQCFKFGYDFSAAMYTEGSQIVLGKPVTFYFLAIEMEAPHCFRWMPAPPEMLETGAKKFRRAMQTLKDCRESNRWPGYNQSEELFVDWAPWMQEK